MSVDCISFFKKWKYLFLNSIVYVHIRFNLQIKNKNAVMYFSLWLRKRVVRDWYLAICLCCRRRQRERCSAMASSVSRVGIRRWGVGPSSDSLLAEHCQIQRHLCVPLFLPYWVCLAEGCDFCHQEWGPNSYWSSFFISLDQLEEELMTSLSYYQPMLKESVIFSN